MKRGHTPTRMCMICRQRFEKSTIMRYLLPTEGARLEKDEAQTLQGRGYYLCHSKECQQKFTGLIKRKGKGV